MIEKDGESPPTLVDARPSTRWTDGRIGFHLRLAQEAAFLAFSRRIGEDHIWPGWFSLLMIIRENPDINQTALSRAVGRDKSTLTTSLRELVRKGLVARERSTVDRRNYTLRLTSLGNVRADEMLVHARAHDKILDSIVGRENKRAFVDILKRIAAEIG